MDHAYGNCSSWGSGSPHYIFAVEGRLGLGNAVEDSHSVPISGLECGCACSSCPYHPTSQPTSLACLTKRAGQCWRQSACQARLLSQQSLSVAQERMPPPLRTCRWIRGLSAALSHEARHRPFHVCVASKPCNLQEEHAAALLLERTLAIALRSFACPVAWICHPTAWQARQVHWLLCLRELNTVARSGGLHSPMRHVFWYGRVLSNPMAALCLHHASSHGCHGSSTDLPIEC